MPVIASVQQIRRRARRVAGSTLPHLAGVRAGRMPSVLRCSDLSTSGAAASAMPNPSLELTCYGRQRNAGLRYFVHCLSPALRRLPARSAQLER